MSPLYENMKEVTQTQIDIATTCDEIKEMLLDKNKRYGDSALSPLRIFSKADAVEQIKCRLDDKLSRLSNQRSDEDEDVILDLLGYLILLLISQRRNKLTQLNMVR